jgi:hypothetical protein
MHKFNTNCLKSPSHGFQRRTERCLHFNGDGSHTHCNALIAYASVQVQDGKSYRLPCICSEGVSASCEKFEVAE